ncbi:hypothetical protein N8937_02350 [Candidatus Pelagibacter ubique]|nr:hypothetical protein [Candidatus Pelagibacter ubique]
MKKLYIFLVISVSLITSANSKIVTLSECFPIARDVSRFSGVHREINQPSTNFKKEIFELNNVYVDIENYELASHYKYKDSFYLKVAAEGPYPQEHVYYIVQKKDKALVDMDKKNFVITFTEFFKDTYYFENRKKYESKLIDVGYKWSDPYSITKVDLLNGVIKNTIYEFKGTDYRITQCGTISEGKILKGTINDSYHVYLNNNSYLKGTQNDSIKLFYDRFTGGMRECSYDPSITGNCSAFKSYSKNSYNKDSLFFNPQTGGMQPCIGTVTFNGQCTAYGIYKPGQASKDQLFYNPKTKDMTTCMMIGANGKCLSYDIIPRKGSTGGSYIVDSKVNPYYKSVPMNSSQLINLGLNMLNGSCTLGLNC